ncbi:RipA family octameric membrane protein [Prosthecodimorpha staleyi]|uniref:Uncharacterized protein n=1 Tax=Prosthecodimorpha staleyi TaxID=2840188 RepID=A0A947G9N0_9HYPH|nr:hypothetical protein [Prosthecodimorpha staleyi]MBT9288123.1 hypothetical protein [Prosthecodimorpha staleyi]
MSADDFDIYKIYRQRVLDENEVIANRLNWLLVFHVILFALCGSAIQLGKTFIFDRDFVFYILFLVSVFGLAISVMGLLAVKAAQDEIVDVIKAFKASFPQIDANVRIPKLTGSPKRHFHGVRTAKGVPILLAFIWISFASLLIWQLCNHRLKGTAVQTSQADITRAFSSLTPQLAVTERTVRNHRRLVIRV